MKNKRLSLLLVGILIAAIFTVPSLLSKFIPIIQDGSIIQKADHCPTSKDFPHENLSLASYQNGVCEWRGVIYRTDDGYRLEYDEDRKSVEFEAEEVLMVILKRKPSE